MMQETLQQWDAQIKYYGIDFKYPEQLQELAQCYERKIPLLEKQLLQIAYAKAKPELFPETDVRTEQSRMEKLARLKDKYACVLKEQEFRAGKLVIRQLHRTVYYIDLTNGSNSRTGLKIGNYIIDSTADTTHFVDASLTGADDYINGSYFWNVTRNLGSLITDFVALTDTVTLATAIVGMVAGDEYYILDAWLTVGQYTTTTARTAGDIAYVRANTSQIPTANIVFDEDGTIASPISIIGCDATTNDPWNDDSDVRPIVDFNDGAYSLSADSDNRWTINRLDIRQSAADGGLIIWESAGWNLTNCIFREASAATAMGLYMYRATANLVDCQFYSNKTRNFACMRSIARLVGCIFDGGADTTDYGVYVDNAQVYLNSCTFGVTTTHDTDCIYFSFDGGTVYARNCAFTGTLLIFAGVAGNFFSEDHNQVKGAQDSESPLGIITRDSTIPLDSLDSAKIAPANNAALGELGLTLSQQPDHDYAIWCPASATTITIKARETVAWATDPSATLFYFEASYLNHATLATRSTVASAQGLSGTTEISFTMTFTPAQAGWVYVTCYLKKYEASKYVNVSVKPALS